MEPKEKTPEEQLKAILIEVDASSEQPIPAEPRFGASWKANALESYPFDLVVDMAVKQGRRAILLEGYLLKLLAERSKA